MKFITLTKKDNGNQIVINPKQIVAMEYEDNDDTSIYSDNDSVIIYAGNGIFQVRECMTEIFEKIREKE